MPHQDSSEPKITNTFAERVSAQHELARYGITAHQRQAYTSLSDVLARGLNPFGYSVDSLDDYVRAFSGVTAGAIAGENPLMEERLARGLEETKDPVMHDQLAFGIRSFNSRMDAWRLYLGLPQEHETFGVSNFKPEHSTEDHYYYSLAHFVENVGYMQKHVGKNEPVVKYLLERIAGSVDWKEKSNPKSMAWQNPDALSVKHHGNTSSIAVDIENAVMGNYTLSKGHDEHGEYVSYYDSWDLDGSVEGKEGVIGKPFEIYDRIYYDPTTYQTISPQQ